jgi:hypothetical protein
VRIGGGQIARTDIHAKRATESGLPACARLADREGRNWRTRENGRTDTAHKIPDATAFGRTETDAFTQTQIGALSAAQIGQLTAIRLRLERRAGGSLHLRAEYLEELHGLADGLKIPLERAAAQYSNSRLSFPKRGCSSVMTNALYGRNYDYSPR